MEAKADKREEIMGRIMHDDALARLNKLDIEKPEMVEKLKEKLFQMWFREEIKDGGVTDAYLKQLIEADEVRARTRQLFCTFPDLFLTTMLLHRRLQNTTASRGVALDRRRFGDDSDSDIDLDGL